MKTEKILQMGTPSYWWKLTILPRKSYKWVLHLTDENWHSPGQKSGLIEEDSNAQNNRQDVNKILQRLVKGKEVRVESWGYFYATVIVWHR